LIVLIVTNDHNRKVSVSAQVLGRRRTADSSSSRDSRFKVPPPPVDGIETVTRFLNIPNDIGSLSLPIMLFRIDSRAPALEGQRKEQKLLMQMSILESSRKSTVV
jgi:hypothetical protein